MSQLASLPGEQWKVIPEFPDYSVSNFGRVVSFKYTKPQFLKFLINCEGFSYVCLSKTPGVRATPVKVSRLVAQVFIPNPNNYRYVLHINGDKSDNSVANLAWNVSVYWQQNKIKRKAVKKPIEINCTFWHPKHGVVTCSTRELATKYQLPFSIVQSVAKGKHKSVKDWQLYPAELTDYVTIRQLVASGELYTLIHIEERLAMLPDIEKAAAKVYQVITGKSPISLKGVCFYPDSWKYMLKSIVFRYWQEHSIVALE
jgi:NUMOD4 motif-containing protein